MSAPDGGRRPARRPSSPGRPSLARPARRSPASRRSRAIEAVVISILALAIVVLVVIQVIYRRRVLQRREASGQRVVGRGTYVVFGVMAAFFLFAVFVFPLLVRG